jgi:hypothetical protein
MPLNHLFQNFRSAGVIPGSFGINDGDGAAGANAEAINFAPINERFRTGQIQFFQPLLEKVPRSDCLSQRSALRLGLVGTEEDVPFILFEAELLDGCP